MTRWRPKRPKETDIGEAAVAWLNEWKWDVWQEVSFEQGQRADVVGLQNNILCVVECKTALTFEVIAQAMRWEMHYRYIAVPTARSSDGRHLACNICRNLGIGVLEVSGNSVEEFVKPKFLRVPLNLSRRRILMLQDIPRDYAPAGATSGNGYSPWSSYKGTMERVRQFLLKNPGVGIAEIVAKVKHHYTNSSSARGNIPKWLQTVESSWCRTEHEGRRLKFFVREGFENVKVGDFTKL